MMVAKLPGWLLDIVNNIKFGTVHGDSIWPFS